MEEGPLLISNFAGASVSKKKLCTKMKNRMNKYLVERQFMINGEVGAFKNFDGLEEQDITEEFMGLWAGYLYNTFKSWKSIQNMFSSSKVWLAPRFPNNIALTDQVRVSSVFSNQCESNQCERPLL